MPLIEEKKFPKLPILIVLVILIGILFIPIGNNKKNRYGPFNAHSIQPYRIENTFGRSWEAEILSVTNDSLKEMGSMAGKYALVDIARISQDGLTYYLNKNTPSRDRERFASERQKWSGEEHWNVGGFLLLLALDAMGMIH